jgi:phospho-N-acetylmuramoyl-pentapeptide-transferase
MGDTGALALGALLAAVALASGWVLLLPVIGIVFVAETLSVMLQVSYFKLTGGKRIFRMSPLHHHCELSGWPEVQIVQRFWIAGTIGGLLGVALGLL